MTNDKLYKRLQIEKGKSQEVPNSFDYPKKDRVGTVLTIINLPISLGS